MNSILNHSSWHFIYKQQTHLQKQIETYETQQLAERKQKVKLFVSHFGMLSHRLLKRKGTKAMYNGSINNHSPQKSASVAF